MTEGRCQCADVEGHGGPSSVFPCINPLSEPKNVKCRPCAKGWHVHFSCESYIPEAVKHLVKTCAACGFDSASHPIPRGSF